MDKWEKLTENDRKILKYLHKWKDEAIKAYRIAKFTQLNIKTTYNCLKKLRKLEYVERKGISPALWQLNFSKRSNLFFWEIQCPKCKSSMVIHSEQQTRVCINKNCLTKKGARTRFYINKNRYVRISDNLKWGQKSKDQDNVNEDKVFVASPKVSNLGNVYLTLKQDELKGGSAEDETENIENQGW
ncbi:MAG TPA: hypothetical protein P5277_01285 [Candidatus Paceibacterota bacterium]|nr:hypothetical protein [Candidatus Paceibacterota bacterium]